MVTHNVYTETNQILSTDLSLNHNTNPDHKSPTDSLITTAVRNIPRSRLIRLY